MNSLAYALRVPLRTVAIVTALALFAWTTGLPAWVHVSNAASVEQFSVTLSDSDLSAFNDITIQFDNPSAIADGEFFEIAFTDPDGNGSNFDLSAVEFDDLSIAGPLTLVTSCGVVTANTVAINPDTTTTLLGEACGAISGGTTFALTISGATSADQVQNPSAEGSYVVSVYGTTTPAITDSGATRVAIIDDVTVTASVDTIFTFTINGVDEGVTVNDDTQPTTGTTTATTVPFGTIAPLTEYQMAQRLTVDTNALNGFSVTVFADQTLTAGNGATIDEFIDGSPDVASTSEWQAPAGTFGSTDTYGHWGLTSDDDALSGIATEDYGTGEAWYRGDFMSSTTPREVFYHGTAVDQNAGVGIGSTTVAYKIEITNLQEAATDYTATLTYVATPVF
jgi:hypothetical protein